MEGFIGIFCENFVKFRRENQLELSDSWPLDCDICGRIKRRLD